MIRWGRGNRRGCCVVIPIGCLFSVLIVILLTGLAVAQLHQIPSHRRQLRGRSFVEFRLASGQMRLWRLKGGSPLEREDVAGCRGYGS
jgi:hypothetical protein